MIFITMKIISSIGLIIVIPLLMTIYSSGKDFNLLQASVQPLSTISNDANSSSINERISNLSTASPEQTIYLRGMGASKQPVYLNFPQQESQQQSINILLHRDDGASYRGILTFTATEPVEVGFGHRVPLNNSNDSQMESKEISELLTVKHNDKGELEVPDIISAPSRITPDYGVNPPYFSASIPFVGSSLFLSTMASEDEPFVAVYEVSADVIQPMNFVDLDGLKMGNSTDAAT